MEKDFSFLQHLKSVSSEEQDYQGLDPKHLWLFHFSDTDVIGPFLEDDLIKLIPRFRHELAPLNVCTLEHKEIRPFFDHPTFNNRDFTKELHPKTKFRKNELVADYYHCMINGSKKGPYKSEDVKEMMQNNEIKADALVSADNGMTWHRAYSYPQFNRRKGAQKAGHQITMPEDAIEKTRIMVVEKIGKSQDQQDSGAVSAALLSSKNSFLNKEKIKNIFSQHSAVKGSSNNKNSLSQVNKKANPLFVTIMVLALGILFFVDSGENKKSKRLDPFDSLQGKSRKYRENTSSKYEDQAPPRPVNTDNFNDQSTTYKHNQFNKNTLDENINSEEMDFDQEPQEFSENLDKDGAKRDVSSTKKKSPKKFTVPHQQDEPDNSDEIDPDSSDSDVSADDSEDFELTE